MSLLARTYEQIVAEKEAFYAAHPDWQHYPYRHSAEQFGRLLQLWAQLIETQNGQDIDDYILTPGRDKISLLVQPFCPPPARLLVLGTGTGREVAMARELGYSALGTSLAPRNLVFAREIVGVDVLFCDHHLLPIPNETFDCVAGFQVLEHTLSPLIMLLECNRILKEGGFCILETPPAVHFTMDSNLHHVLCPVPVQVEGLMLKSNFTNIQLFRRGTQKLELLTQEEKSSAAIEFIVAAQRGPNSQIQQGLKALLDS